MAILPSENSPIAPFDYQEIMDSVKELEAEKEAGINFMAQHLIVAQKDRLPAELAEQILSNCSPRIKTLINRFLIANKHPARTKRVLTPDKLLLVGPPGVGKSDMAKAIAQAIGRPFTFIRSSLLANEYQNSGAQNLKRTILEVQESKVPYVIILDEIQCLIDKKKNDQRADQDTAVAFWQIIDECSADKNILFICTTNSLENMPEALQSRFTNSIVEVCLPDAAQRKKILSFYLQEHADIGLITLIANKIQGYSTREIKELAHEMIALAAEKESPVVYYDDYLIARSEIELNKSRFQTSCKKAIIEYCRVNGLAIIGTNIGGLSLLLNYMQFNRSAYDMLFYKSLNRSREHLDSAIN